VSSLVVTLKETLRYRGAIGQWSWILHRLSGIGILLFFVIHIVDTSWSVFYPGLYEKAIAVYQTPLFTIGEFALIAAVVYHAYNGLRIVILDYKPQWWRFQERAAWWVLGLTVLTLAPVFFLMFNHVLHYYQEDPAMLGLTKVIESQMPFVLGIVLAFIAALILSGIVSLVSGNSSPAPANKGRGSKAERFWWSYMRISGLLIVPLVFGHLAMMHVIQGVFDLTVAGGSVAGVTATGTELFGNAINDTGTAVEYVGERWNYLVTSVAVWRFYDFALLVLAGVHGFNGLRYVLTDYTMSNPLLRRASIYVCVIGAVIVLGVGAGALAGTIDRSAVKIALKARYDLELGVREVDGHTSPYLDELREELGITTTGESETPVDADGGTVIEPESSTDDTSAEAPVNEETSTGDGETESPSSEDDAS
jgi:succinate dehydrogenase / fumarate reductase cytochrome b subunit